MLGLGGSAWSGGGVEEAWAGESDDSVVGDAEDWSSGGSAASSCWSWASMAGVGLSVWSGGPVGGKGSGQRMVPEWVRPVGMVGRCTC